MAGCSVRKNNHRLKAGGYLVLKNSHLPEGASIPYEKNKEVLANPEYNNQRSHMTAIRSVFYIMRSLKRTNSADNPA
jgi:hypothetical protein